MLARKEALHTCSASLCERFGSLLLTNELREWPKASAGGAEGLASKDNSEIKRNVTPKCNRQGECHFLDANPVGENDSNCDVHGACGRGAAGRGMRCNLSRPSHKRCAQQGSHHLLQARDPGSQAQSSTAKTLAGA